MRTLEVEQKLEILGEQAQYDVSAPGTGSLREIRAGARRAPDGPAAAVGDAACRLTSLEHCIYPAAAGGGRCLPVLKVLMTNACRNDCHYCATRASADFRRTGFRPEELARAFAEMDRRGLVQGLFLSSGIPAEPDRVQAMIVDTAALLRRRYHYRGYLHLKVVPGASDAAIEETVRLASRVSVNLEAPSADCLARIAPDKDFAAGVMGTLERASRAARAAGIASGVTTQYVAGAAGESDAELLQATFDLYRRLDLRRAYYSGFRPVGGTPLDAVPAASDLRERRLYQADFLLRQYGFAADELVFGEGDNLPEDADPKLVWAAAHPERFPVEVTAASREELLRVPGFGPVAVARILEARRKGGLSDERGLAALGTRARAAAAFVTIRGRVPASARTLQLSLPLG